MSELYVSAVLGRPVIDPSGAQLGRLDDLGLIPGDTLPSVSGLFIHQGGKRRYRVLAGRFGDRRAAAAARSAVIAATGVAPIVTPVAPGDIPGLRCR